MQRARFSRYFSVFISLLMVITMVSISQGTVLAEQGTDAATGLQYNIQNGEATILGFTAPEGFNGQLVIPATLGGAPVTRIESDKFDDDGFREGIVALSDRADLTSLTLSNGVTNIGLYAFSNCTSLTSVTLPNSVTSIGGFAFKGCTSLKGITIPSSVTSIGDGAFFGCEGLTSITLSSGVTSISAFTFQDCTGLTSIAIPDGVTSIGHVAFMGCTNLSKAYFNGNAPVLVGRQVFDGCAPDFAVCYLSTNTGFTNPWNGYKTIAGDKDKGFDPIILLGIGVTVLVAGAIIFYVIRKRKK